MLLLTHKVLSKQTIFFIKKSKNNNFYEREDWNRLHEKDYGVFVIS